MPVAQDKLDAFIKRHLLTKTAMNARNHKYEVDDIMELCDMTKEILANAPMLARLMPPCAIVGDIHGQYSDLLRVFGGLKRRKLDESDDLKLSGALKYKFMFLGDYIDRGRHSLECILLVFALKCRYPDKYQLLRGNHETRAINREYGFHGELSDRFGREQAEELWKEFNEVFSWMPVAGLIGNKILCMHGGLSPHLTKLSDIEEIPRPLDDPSTNQLAMDLLWADPMHDVIGFKENTTRGVSVFFGEDEVHKACDKLGVMLIVRAHQVMMTGYSLFADRKLMTVFTAPRYQGDVPNSGAVAIVGATGHIGFEILRPATRDTYTDPTNKSDSGSIPEGTKGKKAGGTKPAEKNRKLIESGRGGGGAAAKGKPKPDAAANMKTAESSTAPSSEGLGPQVKK